jgi:hypothetical protein
LRPEIFINPRVQSLRDALPKYRADRALLDKPAVAPELPSNVSPISRSSKNAWKTKTNPGLDFRLRTPRKIRTMVDATSTLRVTAKARPPAPSATIDGMDKRPWQFTTRGILWATFWLGACFGSWTYLINNVDWEQPGGYPAYHTPFEGTLGLLALGSPFVAYQALLGRNRLGIAFGLCVLLFAIHESIRSGLFP